MLVSVEKLVNYMGEVELTDEQTMIVGTVILPGVQEQLENYCNRPLEPVIVREGLRPNETGFLYFRTTPIHTILSITRSDGVQVILSSSSPPALPDNPDELRVLDEWGDPDLFGYQLNTFTAGGGFPIFGAPVSYRAVYIAGYNGYVNTGLQLDICRVAARDCEMMFDDAMTIRGGTTEAASDSDTRPKGWTDDEMKRWDRLRRRVVV